MALTGKYPGTLTGQGSVYEKADNGNLVCCLLVLVESVELKYHFTLATQADGIKEKTVANLKAILTEWSGDIGELFDIVASGSYAGREVEADCEPREYNGKTFTSIKWLNPPGGGGAQMPQSTDRSALLKKYGPKFRALSPQKPKPSTPTAAPAPKPAAPKPRPAPKAAVESSTAEACWAAINVVLEGKPDDEIQAKWYELIGGESVDTSSWDGQKWGEILLAINKLKDEIPY